MEWFKKKPAAEKVEKDQRPAQLGLHRKHFQQALKDLRNAHETRHWRRNYIYQLPWYVVIGAPQAGKTTMLTHSEHSFSSGQRLYPPPAENDDHASPCDWWLTEDAVLLDTPGIYMEPDKAHESGSSEWLGFLDLLRKYRTRCPLNGVIITLSAMDLMQAHTTRGSAQATLLRQRLNELHERLGVHPPIYLMVTKCDLLAGFNEFFGDLNSDECTQVWGLTFPVTCKTDIKVLLDSFSGEFGALHKQLQMHVLTRMQQETNDHRRALIYSFPQQFAGLQSALRQFLETTFGASHFEDPAVLSGVYFTSAIQQGQPVYRVMSSVAATLEWVPPVTSAVDLEERAYFLTRLWREVIFREAGRVGDNRRLERRRQWLRRGALGVSIVAPIIACAVILLAYQRNSQSMAQLSESVVKLKNKVQNVSSQSDLLVLLPLFDEARDLANAYRLQNQSASFWSRRVLYQDDTLAYNLELTYQQLLQEGLLPLLVRTLEDELRRGEANSPDEQYQFLRAYLMLGDPAHFDAETVRITVITKWREKFLYNASQAQQNEVDDHLAALLRSVQFKASLPLNNELIEQARATLGHLPLAQRVFNNLKRRLEKTNLPPFSLSAAAGRNASLALLRHSGASLADGVSGVYTQKGYAQFRVLCDEAVTEVEKANWVLGQKQADISTENIAALKITLAQLYFKEYIEQWDNFLKDIDLLPFEKLAQGASIAKLLAAADSPLRLLVNAVVQETTLAQTDAAKAPAYALENTVDTHFQALHDVVKKTEAAEQTPLAQVLSMLKEVAMFLDAADTAHAYNLPIPTSNALSQLRLAIQGMPAPLPNVLDGVVTDSMALLKDGERARLNALWMTNIAPFCQQAIGGRYPLVANSMHDVTQEDFAKIFGPGRLIDDFFEKNLKAYVDMSKPKWRWRNNTLGIADDVLMQFQRAAQIRDAFFQDGGKAVSIRFNLKLVNIDSTIAKFTLELDGQKLLATHGAAQPVQFQWPSGNGTGLAHMTFLPAKDQKDVMKDGPWAVLRLLDTGRLESTQQADRFKLTFDSAGRKVVFELNASSVINPFKRTVFEKFRCPAHL